MKKPTIVGKILVAHIEGHIDELDKAMRLAAIVARCYSHNLDYLRNFQPGVQTGEGRDIAESLFSVGLLTSNGIDGGGFNNPGGTIYEINQYGELLLEYGLNM